MKLRALALLAVVDGMASRHVEIDVLFAYTPSVDDPRAVAERALAMTNAANRASEVDVTFRVAGVVAVAGEAGRGTQRLYDDLLAHRDFAEAHAARKRLRADVLVLLVEVDRGERGLAPVMPPAADAVAVVDHRAAVGEMAVAHELGHILGARHEVGEDDRDFPFPYGHGYVGPHGRTIMTTPSAVPLVPRWSTGQDATADDARVLRETAATVAAFGDAL